jgi:hypothetical protein
LFIAAGGSFDPVAWTTAAWLEGDGLLPAPLAPQALGVLPEESPQQVEPFFLSYESLASSPHFQLAGLSEPELRDLYSEPLFFKAIKVQLSEESQRQLIRSEQRRLRRLTVANEAAEGTATDWLIWKSPVRADQNATASVGTADATPDPSAAQATVCARLTNPGEDVFLAERTIGRGRVLFVSTGLLASWNTVAQTNAVVMWDHILRGLIRDTLPRRNFFPQPRIALPIPQRDRGITVRLDRPGATESAESVDIGFVGPSEYGVVVEDAWQRGSVSYTHLTLPTTPYV